MIKIIRRDGMQTSILEVTQGAFNNIYKHQGYVPMETATEPPPEDGKTPPPSDDEMFLNTVEAKPISQWSKKEMQQYATLKGIDPKSADLREAIKQKIEDERH